MSVLASARVLRLLLAAVALVAALWMIGAWRQERRLADAARALSQGRAEAAVRLAREVDGELRSARALRIVTLAELQRGNLPAAERAAAQAARDAPDDWARRYDHAVLLGRLGRRSAAAREMEAAVALNPRVTLPIGFLAE